MRTTGRIAGLDVWRTALMLGGLVLHASLMKEATPFYEIVGIVSGSFRMGAFFAISGLLAGLALRRRETGAWLRRRTFQIGVPTAFALLVLCPIGAFSKLAMPSQSAALGPALLDWQHAWFLVALLLYAPIAGWLDARNKRRSLFLGAAGRPWTLRWLVLADIPLVSFALMGAVVLVVARIAPEPYWPALSQ